MSSTAAKYGGKEIFTHYAPTKAAIENLTIGLSRELVDKKIRVLSVSRSNLNKIAKYQK